MKGFFPVGGCLGGVFRCQHGHHGQNLELEIGLIADGIF
jgi:hypothetical protein